jgi:hypothetical protein
MNDEPNLFDRFGGIRPMAEALNERPSTVQSWKTAGRVPATKQPDVLARAGQLGILERYRAAFAHHEAAMLKHPGIRNGRLAKNHAQLAAMLDAMRLVVRPLSDADVTAAHAAIVDMLEQRQKAVETDHPHVEWFWERVDHMRGIDGNVSDRPINHSRTPDLLAISLVQFEQRCGELNQRMPCAANELKRLLRSSKARKFEAVKTVNSITDKSVACWVFRNPDHVSPTPKS